MKDGLLTNTFLSLRPNLHGRRIILVLGSPECDVFPAFSLHAKDCIWGEGNVSDILLVIME